MTATRAGQHKHHLGHWVRVQSHNFEAEEKVNASPSPNVSQAPNRKFAFNPMEEVVCFLEPGRPRIRLRQSTLRDISVAHGEPIGL